MNLSKRQTAKILLLVVVILSSISLVEATVRYLGFFNALANVELELDGIKFTTTSDDLKVSVTIRFRNPTGYGELLLNGITGTAYYEGDNHTVRTSPGGPRSGTPYQEIVTNLWQLPDGYISPMQPIQVRPYSTSRFVMNITAHGEEAQSFNDYYEKPSTEGNIHWQLGFRVSITTPVFLKTMELQYDYSR